MPTKPAKKLARAELARDLKDLGRKIGTVGRNLAMKTRKSLEGAAENTLDLADEALATARKKVRKAGLRVKAKKRAAKPSPQRA